MRCVLQERVKKTAVAKTIPLSESFVRETEHIYGQKYVSYNFHLLPHLPPSVIDWGCMYAWSTFIPEGLNGELNSLCQGTQSIVEQMAQRYMMRNQLRNEAIDVMSKNNLPKPILEMLQNLLCLPVGEHKKFATIKGRQIEIVKLLGRSLMRPLDADEKTACDECFARLSFPTIRSANWELFPRLMLSHGSIYTTTSYKRSPNRVNYCALMNDGQFIFIQSIIYCPDCPIPKCFIIANVLGDTSKSVVHPSDIFELENIPGQTTQFVNTKGPLKVYDATEIEKKGVLGCYNTLNDSGTVTALVNRLESD